MYTQTKHQVVEIIKKNGPSRAHDLANILGITPAALHRALKVLIEAGVLEKRGTPPKVFYSLAKPDAQVLQVDINTSDKETLATKYLYVSPEGKMLSGLDGFLTWMRATSNKQKPENCIRDYLAVLSEAESLRSSNHLIPAKERFFKVFADSALDQIYYFDFYSLIKFGKTKIGQLLHHGKSGQNKKIILQIADMIKKPLEALIKHEKIDAIVWVPHSLPRKVQFLKVVEKHCNLLSPKIEVLKVFSGDVAIAQKSLSKIEERIQNARSTMIVTSNKLRYKNVLIIDDAVGSGATLNEIAKMIKHKGAIKVLGFAVVGSYKGFEVIKEI